jgi:HD-like signal output (HDOD) protein
VIPLFRRFFGKKPPPPGAESHALQGASAAPAVPAPPPEPDAFDAPWALLTGVVLPRERPWSAEEEAQAAALVPLVLAEFSKHRPSPTAFPALAVQIIDLLNGPDVDMAKLLKAISPDPAISVNVLRVANSALYSRGGEVNDMRMAVMRIGLRGVGEIAAGVAGRTLFDVALRVEYEIFGERWNNLFLDTMAVAFGASQFAFEQNVGRADRAFLAGMFHDMGKSLALRSLAGLVISGQVPAPIPEAVVDEVLERTHVETGATAMGIWGLPQHLIEACLHHHDAEVPGDADAMELHILRMVSGIHRLVKDQEDPRRLAETRQSIEAMRLDRRGVKRLHRELEAQTERVKVLFPA